MTALKLTSREREIVVMAARGLHDKEIARLLSLSPGTIRTHLRRVHARNDIKGRVEMVVAWLQAHTTP